MGSTATLDADEDREPVDQREYRSMIGSLLYLTATSSGVANGYARYALAYPENWQADVPVKRKSLAIMSRVSTCKKESSTKRWLLARNITA
jgi:hypothetical protein